VTEQEREDWDELVEMVTEPCPGREVFIGNFRDAIRAANDMLFRITTLNFCSGCGLGFRLKDMREIKGKNFCIDCLLRTATEPLPLIKDEN